MKYALQNAEIPIYQTDEDGNILYYEDSEGNKIPIETGETEIGYSIPQEFLSNFSMSGGEAEAQEYGLDISSYDAIMIMQKNAVPITEGSLIWIESKVGYKDSGNTIVDGDTADFTVVAVKPSLNFTKYVLKKTVK